MTRFRPSRSDDHLSNYWNALVRNAPAEELARLARLVEPSEIAAIERAHAAHERHEPDPAFARRLERTLMNTAFSPITGTIPQPGVSPPSRDGSGTPGSRTRRRAGVPRSRRSWAFAPALGIGIALIVLLLLASAAGIWLTRDRQDEPYRLMAPVVATPGPDASPGVPMYRANPERTGVMPGPGIDGQPVERWRAEFDGPLTAVPSLVDGVLFLGVGDGGIHAVDAATGETVWTFAGSSPISSTPAIHNRIVISGSEDGTLYALDAADGSEIWAFPGARAQASVAIVDDTVYTGSGDGFLYALDAATGEEIWSAPLGADASRSPAVSNGVVYQGSGDGVLHTFDAETGEPGWSLNLDGDGIISTTVIHGGVVYQGTFEGEENFFFALDATTGEELWRLESTAGLGFYNAAADGETVYAPTRDGIIYALDATTGEVRWQAATGDGFATGPSLVGDTLYATSTGGDVYALDAATGREQWRYAIEGAANGGVIVSGGVAYLGTSFGYLYAIEGSREPIMAAVAATPIATPLPVVGSTVATPAASPAEPVSTPVVADDLASFVWHSPGGDVEFAQPWDLTIAPDGNLWLADGEHHQFQIFTPDGEWVESWGGTGTGSGDGQFNFTRPNSEGDASSAVAFAPDDSFYVADMGNQRIQHFSADRKFLHAWGGFGPGDGQFLSPNDLEIDSEGNVFVIDAIRGDVQKFTADGAFLLAFGDELSTPGTLNYTSYMIFIDADDHLWVPRGPELPVEEWDADGTLIARHDLTGTVAYPVGIAFDGSGRIFVVDALGPHVVVFDRSLTVIGQWGERGDNPGQFQQPQTIALDREGGAYVSDYYNGLQKFEVTLPAVSGATPAN